MNKTSFQTSSYKTENTLSYWSTTWPERKTEWKKKGYFMSNTNQIFRTYKHFVLGIKFPSPWDISRNKLKVLLPNFQKSLKIIWPYFLFFPLLLTRSAVHSRDWVWQLHSTLLANQAPHLTPFKWPLHSASCFTCAFSYMSWLGTTRLSDSPEVLI